MRHVTCLAVICLGMIVSSSRPAEAMIPIDLRTSWPCAPSTVYIDPLTPKAALAAVAQWRAAFRPDWIVTRDLPADVEIFMQAPANHDDGGLTTVWATATTITRAVVEIDVHAGDVGDFTRHELGHVAGLQHNFDTQFSAMNPYPLLHRYGVEDLAGMRVAARRCVK